MKKVLFFIGLFNSCQSDSNVLKNQNYLLSQEVVQREHELDSLQYNIVKNMIIGITNNNSGNCPPTNVIHGYNRLAEKLGKDLLVEKHLKSCL